MLKKLLLKRVLPSVIGAVVLILAILWLYGYIGVKAGWIGPTQIHNLNAISNSGAKAAGGIAEAAKVKIGL